MPAWFSLAVWLLVSQIIETAIQGFQKVLKVYDTITDRLSDCSFSLFIQHDSNTPALRERLLEHYRTWITTAIVACPAPAFMIFNYNVIKADDVTRSFIECEPFLKKLWEKVDAAMESGNTTTDITDFFTSWLPNSFWSFLTAIWDAIVNNPWRITEEINSQLLAVIQQNPQDEVTALRNFLSKAAKEETGEMKATFDEELLLRLNPFLHLLSPTILAHIRMYWVYSIIEEEPRLITPPDEYLKALFADIFVDGEHIASINPDDNLNIVFSMPPKPEWLIPSKHTAVLNYAGITRKAEFSIIPPLELKVTDSIRQGYKACNLQGGIEIGIDPQDWEGEFWINCNTAWGDSYSLALIEFEHNYEGREFWLSLRVGAYREACYGTAYIVVGYRDEQGLHLYAVGECPYTMLNPGWVTLQGTFPSPRFVAGVYHYCPYQVMATTGARITGIRYGVIP